MAILGPKWPIFKVFGPKFLRFCVNTTISCIIGCKRVCLILSYEHSKFSQKLCHFQAQNGLFLRFFCPKFQKFCVYTSILGIIMRNRVPLIFAYEHSKFSQKLFSQRAFLGPKQPISKKIISGKNAISIKMSDEMIIRFGIEVNEIKCGTYDKRKNTKSKIQH